MVGSRRNGPKPCPVTVGWQNRTDARLSSPSKKQGESPKICDFGSNACNDLSLSGDTNSLVGNTGLAETANRQRRLHTLALAAY